MMASEWLIWRPMETAPRDGVYIVARFARGGYAPIVVQWQENGGWWQEEGALYQDDAFSGWSPIPPMES